MRLREVMTHSLVTLEPDQTVDSAIRLFVERGISGAPVLEHGKLVGVVSEKDIFRALYPSVTEYYNNPELWLEETELEDNAKEVAKKAIVEIMVRDVITASSDMPVMQAGAMMLAHRIHRIVVMDGVKIVGIATRSDIFQAVFKKFI